MATEPESPTQVVHFYARPPRIHPKQVSGRFKRLRILVVVVTQMLFLGLPWLDYQHRQAILWDVSAFEWHFFGLTLLAHELVYLVGLLVLCALGLFWSTAIAGRVWCGHACPQTLYTQMMVWLDGWFEGPRSQRQKLDQAPWHVRKISIKTRKYIAITVFCLWQGFTFVGWFTPIRQMWADVWSWQLSPMTSISVLLCAALLWLMSHVLREQVCLHMCPYARFQSVMVDEHSRLIAYDAQRGEPRAAKNNSTSGACTNCQQCIQVCPTGIDIRDGAMQYACIGCGACVDACDQMMSHLGLDTGLIRYHKTQTPAKNHRLRLWVYSGLIVVIASLMAYHLSTRHAVHVHISPRLDVRTHVNAQGVLENTYQLRLHNTSFQRAQITLAVANGVDAHIQGAPTHLAAHSQISVPIQIRTQKMTSSQAITLNVQYQFDTQSSWHKVSKNTILMGPSP